MKPRTQEQDDLVVAFVLGEYGEVEFFLLAADAGMGFDDIAAVMSDARGEFET